MRQDQKPRCKPFNKKGINISVASPQISKTREISIKATFKNNIFTGQRILIVPEHTTLKRLDQFVATLNVPPDIKNSSPSFNSSLNIFIPIICYLEALWACVGVEENTHLIKLSHFIAPVNRYTTLLPL